MDDRENREWTGGPSGGPGVVGRPYRRVGSGWEELQNDCEWSGCHTGEQGVVGRPSRRAGSGREAIPKGREALPEGWEVPHGVPGVVWMHSQRPGSGREARRAGSGCTALTEVLERSGGSHRGRGIVGKPSWMAGSGQESLLDDQEVLPVSL